MEMPSPITNSKRTKLIKCYNTSITSDSRIVEERADKYICLDSGLIYNGTGARGREEGFYSDHYDLHSEGTESEFKYFENEISIGIYEDIANFINTEVGIMSRSKVLDVGCGKGLLLKRLQEKNPSLNLNGVEPSRNAQKFFKSAYPEVNCYEGLLETSPFLRENFDLIVANGVLEHVPDPVGFLELIGEILDERGYLYIGVPNFHNNPADIFTYDHLSHFTPDTISTVFRLAGFQIISSKVLSNRVPMWFILKKINKVPLNKISVDILASTQLAQRAIDQVQAFFDSYDNAVEMARSKAKRIAVYGTGAFAMIGMKHTCLNAQDIAFFVDDNQSIWGSTRIGLPVCDPSILKTSAEISEVIISANPCYINLIENKLKDILRDSPIAVHVPKT